MDYDALTLIEVVEHLNYNDLDNLNSNVFGFLNPKIVIITMILIIFLIKIKNVIMKLELLEILIIDLNSQETNLKNCAMKYV